MVCRRLASAATTVVSKANGVELRDRDARHSLSLLALPMLKWAPVLRGLRCSELWYTKPDLCTFLRRATHLQSLELSCSDQLMAAQAGYLMANSCATHIRVFGSHMPGRFPAGMTRLHAVFPSGSRCGEAPSCSPNALIYTLANHLCLTQLILQFYSDQIVLSCPIWLPELDISIQFDVKEEIYLDLGWLMRQPCRSLGVNLTFFTVDHSLHEYVVEHLGKMPVSTLTTDFYTDSCEHCVGLLASLDIVLAAH